MSWECPRCMVTFDEPPEMAVGKDSVMKIWKSDLQGLLEEVKGAVYLFSSSETHGGELPMVSFVVSVAGFNDENHICELRVARSAVPMMMMSDVKRESQKNQDALNDVKQRLTALNREYRDGRIGDTPVNGVLE